ncbi:hypothetical protein NLJ89_g2934 [Agrocybe chaxingu]|uniref:Uncharacterized protein n=1 Tax=Agrocybe chaxingu TaxID=84603 RepID=A0A9W8KAJ5_9AGAR|nr:hypothetical protein NLJ89_g2934 [Agrocybe chaxingu]
MIFTGGPLHQAPSRLKSASMPVNHREESWSSMSTTWRKTTSRFSSSNVVPKSHKRRPPSLDAMIYGNLTPSPSCSVLYAMTRADTGDGADAQHFGFLCLLWLLREANHNLRIIEAEKTNDIGSTVGLIFLRLALHATASSAS